jgi:hypothetical protein
MLIIFGVLLMAVFGLGPVFDNLARGFQGSSSAYEDEVVAKWRGGTISRSVLDGLKRKHYETRRFLAELANQAKAECERKGVQYQPLASSLQPLQRENDDDAVDQQLIDRLLLAEKASDEGVVISDGMIDDYLTLVAGQADFTRADWKMINKVANQRAAFPAIREHLRLELKAMQMQTYAGLGLPLNPIPTEAVELYGRANNRIECEVLPVSVDQYLEKVSGEPSVGEMQALFTQGQYNYEDYGLRKPGFKIPRKVNVQYLVAEMETFLQNEKNKITDEQVEAEYDKMVESEDPMVVEVIESETPGGGFKLDLGDDPAEKPESDKPESSDAMDDSSKADESKTPETSEQPKTEQPKAEEPKVEESKPDDVKKEEAPAEKQDTETQSEEAKSEEAKSEETESETAGEGDQSLVVNSKKLQLVSFLQEGSTDAQDEASETEAAETPVASDQEEVGGLGGLQLSDDTTGPAVDGGTKSEKVIKPLADVADAIRTRMARKRAFDKKDDAQKRAVATITLYQQQLMRWEAMRDGEKSDADKPAAPDFEKIAADNGMVFRETGLVDLFELSNTDFGKVNYPIQVRSPQGPMRMDIQQVSNRVFLEYDDNGLIAPQEVDDIMNGNAYVYWMSEKVETRVPDSYEECRDKIVKFWKHQKAVELAREAAESMAEKAKSAGKTLAETFPEKVDATGEFTWLRPGSTAQATYGMPFRVENPGEKFMQTAFGLNEGEIGVAANEPRDTVYVIQRITPPMSVAEIGQEYLDEQFFRFKRVPTDVMGGAIRYARELDMDFNEDFVESMDLKRLK